MRLASSPDFSSETSRLVDSCLARVRATAHLDDDVVLPPLPRPNPRRNVEIFTKSQVFTVAGAAAARPPVAVAAPESQTESLLHRGRWAVLLSVFVVSAFGGAAFMVSPAGQSARVQRYTQVAVEQVQMAKDAAFSLFTRR